MIIQKGQKKRFLIIIIILFVSIPVTGFSYTAEDYYNAGVKESARGNCANAIKYYNSAIKLKPKEGKYFSAMADCLRETGQVEKSMSYYNYAEKLGIKEESENQPNPAANRSNMIAVNPSVLLSGFFSLYYERRIFSHLSAGVEGGIAYSMSFLSLASAGSKVSGFGYNLGSRINWFIDGNALSGLFFGPECYFYGANINVTVSDSYGTVVENKTSVSIMSAGAHLGYRWIFENGISLDGIVGLAYITSGLIKFGDMEVKLGIILPTLGTNIGFAF